MDRYVLVCLIEGEVGKFHDKLVGEVCNKFNVRRQKLPAHITLKAPFETDRIDDMLNVLEGFVELHKRSPIKIRDFGKFRRDVVYMDVNISQEGKEVHDELMDELAKISWIEFKANEGKNRVLHCTIVSKRIQDKFKDIWDYVNQYNCDFDVYFDNLSLYRWKNNTWELFRKFKFKDVQ